jgi:hypothetical protein
MFYEGNYVRTKSRGRGNHREDKGRSAHKLEAVSADDRQGDP